jgi:lipopolysaccharide heptosyltransferase I
VLERILILRLGALGDVVHAIPVAAALRRAFPAARIDWLVAAKNRALLDLVPVIDRRIVLGRSTGEGRNGHTLFGTLAELRRSRYDVAIDLQGLLKSAALARSSGADRVVGFSSSYLRERLAALMYTDTYAPGCRGIDDPRETSHIVDINLGLLRTFGVTPTVAEFPIASVDSPVADTVHRLTGGRYVLLNPGAGWPNKRWPPPRFGELAVRLRQRHGVTSVALWGAGERPLAEEVKAHSAGAAIVCPAASIADLVALSRRAALIVSGDTGPMHIAAAVGAPVVGIFGPTRPTRNGPWSVEDVTVSRAEVCRCYRLRRCRLAEPCLLEIGVDEVFDAAGRRLAGLTSHA